MKLCVLASSDPPVSRQSAMNLSMASASPMFVIKHRGDCQATHEWKEACQEIELRHREIAICGSDLLWWRGRHLRERGHALVQLVPRWGRGGVDLHVERQICIVVERAELDRHERLVRGDAPQRGAAIAAKGAADFGPAVAALAEDLRFAFRHFERRDRGERDKVGPTTRCLLTIGAMASADAEERRGDLEANGAAGAAAGGVGHCRSPKDV